jgi:hypothetical protein
VRWISLPLKSLGAFPNARGGDMPKDKLKEDDFPLRVDGDTVVNRKLKPVITAPTPELAEDVAERLNENENKRQEDDWTF